MSEDVRRSLSWWSMLTLAMALPVWFGVVAMGLMPRTSLDGGIFVSVVGGLRNGLPLYSGVWDNKDPLFFLVMTGASYVAPWAMFVLDWGWAVVGAVGTWLVARPLMAGDRAVFLGAVVAPVMLFGPFHEAGMTSLPGTVVALLVLGLLLNRWGVAAGVALGLLAFLKLVVWPIAVVAVLVLLAIPAFRRTGLRSLITAAITLAVGLSALFVAGWLGPYLDALGRNRAYASDVIVYFGYEDSPVGHLRRMADDWALTSSSMALWAAVAVMVAVGIGGLILVIVARSWRTPERIVIVSWLVVSLVGVAGILGLTYVWGHHAQAISLPAVIACVAIATVVPGGWVFPGFVAIVGLASWLLSGWGAPSNALDRVSSARVSWDKHWGSIEGVPTDAKLLGTVQAEDFTFARLGSNEDEGFLLDVPEGAHLACAQFHLYDFSPPEDFARMLDCIQNVDAVLVTDSFVVFGNGGRAASVQPILGYVEGAFTCMSVGDRRVCTRKPA